MLKALYISRKCSHLSRIGKAGALLALVGTLAINTASADITIAPDFPVKDSQPAGKDEPAKSLIESYRNDVLANPAKRADASLKNLTVAKN